MNGPAPRLSLAAAGLPLSCHFASEKATSVDANLRAVHGLPLDGGKFWAMQMAYLSFSIT
jgi:hypothetical protein